ncbi:MAG TPA: hypothetical protein VFT67_10760 [Jatrophihabitantaceae bacterium]|nr:hypothetical protein [Jatrophihabitantaceae bacterium]
MVETVIAAQAPVTRGVRSRWWLWTALVAVVLACLASAAVVAVRHYRYAPALRCACGLAWTGVDTHRISDSQADGHDQLTVPATGGRQAFLVEIVNDSSVTQTILGLGDAGGPTAYQPIVRFGPEAASQGMTEVRYSSRPLAVPPHGGAAVRFSFRSVCLAPGGTLYWDAVRLRVRVGAFTRTESVSFGGTAMAVRGTSASAACP